MVAMMLLGSFSGVLGSFLIFLVSRYGVFSCFIICCVKSIREVIAHLSAQF